MRTMPYVEPIGTNPLSAWRPSTGNSRGLATPEPHLPAREEQRAPRGGQDPGDCASGASWHSSDSHSGRHANDNSKKH